MKKLFLPPAIVAWLVAIAITSAFGIGLLRDSDIVRAIAIRSTLSMTSPLPEDSEGHTNILILGVGDREHSAADLTDTMMIASIDPKTSSVMLLSIPRDLWYAGVGDIPDGRINALYYNFLKQNERASRSGSGASVAAMKSLANEIGNRIGIEIHGAMKMDFTGFENVIDSIGGIDITVQEQIIDYSYPMEEGVVGTLQIDAGPQHFDGERALQYARTRHSSTDFDRSKRQQEILSAVEEKVKKQNVFDDLAMIRELQVTLREHFVTTFTPRQLLGLAGILSGVHHDDIVKMYLNFSVGGDNSESSAGGFVIPAPADVAGSGAILIPWSLSFDVSDWSQIRLLAHLLFSEREIYLRRPQVIVTASGATPLQTHRLRNELVRYGFTVQVEKKVSNMPDTTDAIIVASRDNRSDAEFFSEILGMPVEESQGEEDNVIRIILGKEYRFESLQK